MKNLFQGVFGHLPKLKDPKAVMPVILAGGLGTRLAGVLGQTPKVMAPIGDRPFLAYVFEMLLNHGLEKVWICVGHGSAVIESQFGVSWNNLRIQYSREEKPLGTGGALLRCACAIDAECLLVMNGDTYFGADMEEAFFRHRERNAKATVCLTEVPDTARYGRVLLDREGYIESFEEKSAASGPGSINGGIVFIKKDALCTFLPERHLSLEKEIFPQWVLERTICGFKSPGPFLDIGTPESYAGAVTFFKKIIA